MASVWCDYLPTGWEPIDGEHARLAARLAELSAAVDAGDAARARASLAGLLPAFAEHFAREEQLMRASAYPYAAPHAEAHDLFLADVASIARRAADAGVTPELRWWTAGPVQSWLRLHVARNDVALGRFLLVKEQRCCAPARPVAFAPSPG